MQKLNSSIIARDVEVHHEKDTRWWPRVFNI